MKANYQLDQMPPMTSTMTTTLKETKKNFVNDKDIVQKLKDLKELLDSGVLSNEEFEKAKKKLLN